MYRALTNPESIEKLIADGYEVYQYSSGFLVIQGIPYVNAKREIRTDGVLGTPLANISDHRAFWSGDIPCDVSGLEIRNLILERDYGLNRLQIPSCEIRFPFSFSNKPDEGYPDYYCKMVSYINIISAPACSLDSSLSPKLFNPSKIEGYESPLKYHDTCSIRYNTMEWADRTKNEIVAIIGVGGTGSYLLDIIAKTHVKQIHLYDGDFFETHNAFRAPGAWTPHEIEKHELKVNVFKDIYSRLHGGIVAHPYFISPENISELGLLGVTSIFICIDSGSARKLLVDYSQSNNVFCIDCGVDASFTSNNKITGAVRATYISPNMDYTKRLQLKDIEDQDLDIYSSNIQIVELNAINAVLATVLWKQKKGLYEDTDNVAELDYSVETSCSFLSMDGLMNDE